MKQTKELQNILNAIEKWSKKNDVIFVGNFISFDEDKLEKEDEEDCIKEQRIMGYGGKKEMKLMLKELTQILKEDKEDFINW